MSGVDRGGIAKRLSEKLKQAEELESLGTVSASAWKEVSTIEEELAKAFPVSEGQGRIARRGAVRAALKAGDYDRAQSLTDRYLADQSAPASLATELREIMDEADRVLALRF